MKQIHHFFSTIIRIPGYFLVIVTILGGSFLQACNSSTALLVNFKNDNIGSPPGPAQPTGSVSINTGAGSINVVAAPNPNLPSNKWALISHPNQPTSETTLTGRFARFFGLGKYALLTSMHIPRNAGVVTVQFESFNELGSFLHLDFMPEGNVRIDDSNVRFGHFPRDTNFVLSVNLNITSTAATAEITLLGSGASGNITTNVQTILLPVARQFGAVKYWIGFQHRASFFVDDILVTFRNQ